jgi:hypothetical protein
MPSAAVFFATRETAWCAVAAMSSPCASSQARATCAGVAPASDATAATSSTTRRFCSKLPSVKRGLFLRAVVVGEVLGGADRPGEEAVPERGVGHEADPEVAQQREELGLRIQCPQ